MTDEELEKIREIMLNESIRPEDIDTQLSNVIVGIDDSYVLIKRAHTSESNPRLKRFLEKMARAITEIIPREINGKRISVELESVDHLASLSTSYKNPDVFTIKSTYKMNHKIICSIEMNVSFRYDLDPGDETFMPPFCSEIYNKVLIVLINAAKTDVIDVDAYMHLIERRDRLK